MKIMIAGAGSVGRSIAMEMTRRGHEVIIIDRDPKAMRVASVPSADWVLADACELSTLSQVGLDDCEVVVTATGDDKANLVVSLLSKTEFGVPRVISRINNPANAWLFDESWGVDVPVSTPQIMTSLIEEAVSSGEFVRRLGFYNAGTSLYQGTVAKRAPVVGMALADVVLPADVIVAAIIRDGVPHAADPDITIDAGDQIIIMSSDKYVSDLAEANRLIAAEPNTDDART